MDLEILWQVGLDQYQSTTGDGHEEETRDLFLLTSKMAQVKKV